MVAMATKAENMTVKAPLFWFKNSNTIIFHLPFVALVHRAFRLIWMCPQYFVYHANSSIYTNFVYPLILAVYLRYFTHPSLYMKSSFPSNPPIIFYPLFSFSNNLFSGLLIILKSLLLTAVYNSVVFELLWPS